MTLVGIFSTILVENRNMFASHPEADCINKPRLCVSNDSK